MQLSGLILISYIVNAEKKQVFFFRQILKKIYFLAAASECYYK